ncbi:leucine efflux protein LeuE [Micromonospora sp. CPCC 206061]|uniref:leucine efflux protein LeuE n=1 Tax=Micromonospora sp. CPCC 206061 TaxID=3122410 RepID=UPI002FF41722
MLGITDIWTYVLGTVAIVLLPGPNSLFVLATAARLGVRAGYRAAAGVFLGDSVLMVLSAAGVASLLNAYPPLFLAIKYAGAAYLGYVGLTMVRSAWRRRSAVAAPPSEPVTPRPFRRSLVISLLNPKAILFFVSFFIQFVEPGYPHPAVSFLVLGLIVQVCSVLYLTLLIFTGTRLASQFRRRQRLAKTATTAIGALFVTFSLKLATA